MRNYTLKFCCLLAAACSALPARAVTVDQIISREHPDFATAGARLSVGRDSLVYLSSAGDGTGYVVRIARDGSRKFGGNTVYAIQNATANAAGVMATANTHFAGKVTLYNANYTTIGESHEFANQDQWNAPAHVEAGASGDFYGLDQHRNRIVRISPSGKVLKAYDYSRATEGGQGIVEDFRVDEAHESFFLNDRSGKVWASSFDGRTRWTVAAGAQGAYNSGGFDVDEAGNLFAIRPTGSPLKKYDAQGRESGEVKLATPEAAPGTTVPPITGLRVVDGEAIIKRRDVTALFERYDLATGALKQVVRSPHEHLAITYPSDTWTAGEAVPFSIDFDADGAAVKPRWRVWMRPLDFLHYRELKVQNGKVTLPEDTWGGLYQIKVTPEVLPWQRGPGTEYMVRSWVEVRAPGSMGTVNVMTPQNRAFYGRGEEIPFSVLLRSAAGKNVNVKLVEGADETVSAMPLMQWKVPAGPGVAAALTVPASLTAALRPGNYAIVASAAGMTWVPQRLTIGPGKNRSSFMVMQYGDYAPIYPSDTAIHNPRVPVWDFPDVVGAHLDSTERMGWNLVVDRAGTSSQKNAVSDAVIRNDLEPLRKRLEGDPLAMAPDKIIPAPSFLQVVAGYGARGTDQMAILFNMDVGLPLTGNGFDNRKPDQFLADLATVTNALKPYPAFRGWSYAANWWIYDDPRRKAWTPTEKAEYDEAWKAMKDTGRWSDVLEREQNIRYGYAAQGVDMLNGALKKVAPTAVTATAPSYRNVDAYPPITLQQVDEADLQARFEQIGMPYYAPHAVDFYKRPGKRAWGHPELWNDAGTGDQILPTLWQMAMRGANGVGLSGRVTPWGSLPNDSRISNAGLASVYRANNQLFRQYGPWLETLQSDDEVAIIASGRQFKTDEWARITGRHFARIQEAYTACLGAHRPASIVFPEDLGPDTLKTFKAVLLVGQTIEMEPNLAAALKTARAAGTKIFYDQTCRESLVKEFTPLGVAFNKFENDPHAASDDNAYWRFVAYNKANVPVVEKALSSVVAPVADIANSEVVASRRQSESGEYIFVVNNTPLNLEPGEMWRVTLNCSSRAPLQVPVGLNVPAGRTVYDVFALRTATPVNGSVDTDMRTFPARLYAILPSTIARVALRGPASLAAGSAFDWNAQVLDSNGKPVRASIPLRIRLLGADGAVMEERFLAAGSKGAAGRMRAAVNSRPGNFVLETTELFSGKSAKLTIAMTAAPAQQSNAKPAAAGATGKTATAQLDRAVDNFGPHLRDVTLMDGGKTAVFNAMNWDRNLFAVDLATGKCKWQGKVGQYFSFQPQGLQNGLAVQGFDFKTAEGYHLYVLDSAGNARRRFALYGVPRRGIFRFVPGMVKDQVNSFAAAPNGSWVATCGDLGLAVWSGEGKMLWSQDHWKTNRNTAWMQGVTSHALAEQRTPQVTALGRDVLLVTDDRKTTAYAASNGRQLWQVRLAPTGQTRKIVPAPDGKTLALLTSAESGRTYVVRDGKVVRTLNGPAEEAAFAPDGTTITIAAGKQIKLFSLQDGLQWTLPADDTIRFMQFSPDSKRVAASSDMGTLYVASADGDVLMQRDLKALAVPAWLPDGDLVAGTWMGQVTRLDKHYKTVWSTLLRPDGGDAQAALTKPDTTPTTRIETWGNADFKSGESEPNLLSTTSAQVKWVTPGAGFIQLQGDMRTLYDGKPDPPHDPWLTWSYIGDMAEVRAFNWLQMDTMRMRARATGVTVVEDKAHPESWWRDCYVEYWDQQREEWVFIQTLLSNSASHTHRFAKPVEATRFRIVPAWGLVGNLRFGEIVLHGEAVGPAHPDAFAKRPLATLFDENSELGDVLIWGNNGLEYKFDGAFSGGRYLALRANGKATPLFINGLGHVIPQWDFEIVENPAPGQYRYLQFAWKALAPETQGLTLQLEGRSFHAGRNGANKDLPATRIADTPPREWQTVRVDLWQLFKKPARIQTMSFFTTGGPVAYDQIVLGRTSADLPTESK